MYNQQPRGSNMASNLYQVITREQAIASFEEYILPSVQEEYEQDGEADYTARSEAWSDYVDGLHADHQISDWQLENWDHPDCNYAPWER